MTTTRSEYVNQNDEAARAASPLLEATVVIRRLGERYDNLHRFNGTPCTVECDPGNCETAHREHFGWDAIEAGAAFDRDMVER